VTPSGKCKSNVGRRIAGTKEVLKAKGQTHNNKEIARDI
jgi:hypothetical protein